MTLTNSKEFDLIILNMHTEFNDDLDLTAQLSLLKTVSRDVPLAVIVDAEHDHFSDSLLWRFDVRGYIIHSHNPATLVAAIRLICARGLYQSMLSPALSHHGALAKVEAKASLPVHSGPTPIAAQELTARETDVLRLLQQGKPNKVIAHELSISVNTAKVHVRNIMRKLRATNRTQVVVGVPPPNWTSMQ